MKKNIEIVVENIEREMKKKSPSFEINKAQLVGLSESSFRSAKTRDEIPYSRVIKSCLLNSIDLNEVFKGIDLDTMVKIRKYYPRKEENV